MVGKRNGKVNESEGAGMKVSAKAMKRAIRMASKDYSRPILTCIHLDANGDMVATDSYKLYREQGIWDGPSVDVPPTVARFIADSKGEATIEVTDHTVKATMDDGATFEDNRIDGQYPNYEQLFKGLTRKAEATVCRKDLLDEARKYVKQKVGTMVLVVLGCKPKVSGGDLVTRAAKGGKVAPRRFELACDGEDITLGIDPKFLRDCLLSTEGRIVDLRFTSPIKPLLIQGNGMEVILMPVRQEPGKNMTAKTEAKEEEQVKQTKKEEKVKFNKAEIWMGEDGKAVKHDGYTFHTDIRGTAVEVGLVRRPKGWVTVDACTGKTMDGKPFQSREKAVAHFMENRLTEYKAIYMTEMHEAEAADFGKRILEAQGKPTKGEHVEKANKELAKRAKAAAKAKAGADVEMTVTEGDSITAITFEPERKPKRTAKKQVQHDAPEHAAHDAQEHAVAEAAAVETLSFIDGNAESAEKVMEALRELTKDGNVVVRWKGKPMAPIRVEGDTKPFQEELKERGLRWARKGFWYLKPTIA